LSWTEQEASQQTMSGGGVLTDTYVGSGTDAYNFGGQNMTATGSLYWSSDFRTHTCIVVFA